MLWQDTSGFEKPGQLRPGFLYYYGYRLQTAGLEMSDSVRVRGADKP
jgi:hypothetical protein